MAYDIVKGRIVRNIAIQGHPPWGSYEYAGVRGVPLPEEPPPPKPSASPLDLESELPDLADESGLLGYTVYKISPTDWDASMRWMRNFAENVEYTRKVHKGRILTDDDVTIFVELYRRWQRFVNEVANAARDLPLPKTLLFAAPVTLPYIVAHQMYSAAADMVDAGLMSEANKRRWDALLQEAHKLYHRFRLLGMSQIAVPYMGDLVVLLRGLPATLTLPEMATTLREVARGGDRMLDQNTSWWRWRQSEDTGPLAAAIKACRAFADELDAVANRSEGKGAREKGTPVYLRFVRTAAKVYIEAAGLYGIVETRESAKHEAIEKGADMGQKTTHGLLWLLAAVGLGWLGIKWLSPAKVVVVSGETLGRHTSPGEDDEDGDDEADDDDLAEEPPLRTDWVRKHQENEQP